MFVYSCQHITIKKYDYIVDKSILTPQLIKNSGVKGVCWNQRGENQVKEKKSISRKIVVIASLVMVIVLVPIIVINTVLIVKSYTDQDHIPSLLGISPLVVLSGSMEDTFSTNALIFIKDVDTDDLEVGDVICYLIEDTAVTHRITQVTEDEDGVPAYITQGDANDTEDSYFVYPETVEGMYIGHIAEVGAFVLFMQTTAGMVIFIGLPIVLYLILDFILSRKEKKEDDKKAEALEKELEELKRKMNQE